MLVCCWVEPGPSVSGCRALGFPRVGIRPPVGRAGSWHSWLWCPACPGSWCQLAGGWGKIPGCCLRGPRGPKTWPARAGLGPGASKLEGGFQNSTYQGECPPGRMSSPKWLRPVSLSQGWAPFASCLSRRLLKINEWV